MLQKTAPAVVLLRVLLWKSTPEIAYIQYNSVLFLKILIGNCVYILSLCVLFWKPIPEAVCIYIYIDSGRTVTSAVAAKRKPDLINATTTITTTIQHITTYLRQNVSICRLFSLLTASWHVKMKRYRVNMEQLLASRCLKIRIIQVIYFIMFTLNLHVSLKYTHRKRR